LLAKKQQRERGSTFHPTLHIHNLRKGRKKRGEGEKENPININFKTSLSPKGGGRREEKRKRRPITPTTKKRGERGKKRKRGGPLTINPGRAGESKERRKKKEKRENRLELAPI